MTIAIKVFTTESQTEDKTFPKSQTGRFNLFLFATIFLAMTGSIFSADYDDRRDWQRIVDLRGAWRFELGDDMAWIDPEFDDSDWENVFVPSPWEDEGYPGYDGFAWYRNDFYLEEDVDEKMLYVRLGQIDDVDEVYINGKFVGFNGTLPPDYFTGFFADRNYKIPPGVLKLGAENTIAVRVYDDGMDGGIIHGKIGIYERNYGPALAMDLSGTWKFTADDDDAFQLAEFNHTGWDDVQVPAFWETQGYKDYDGMGWYRTTFRVPAELAAERLVLMLGKIDDYDEVYLNGERIGRTGRIRDNIHRMRRDDLGNKYLQLRAYYIPTSVLRKDGDNVIAVRVYDGWIHGGIYDGPIGLMTRDEYREWKREHQSFANFFEMLWR